MNRRLYRCRHDRRLAGVAAGVAEFFDLDPTLVRVLFFLSILLGGTGLFLYVAMAFIVPLEPASADEPAPITDAGHRHPRRGDGPWTTILGAGLILVGALALVDRFLPALDVEHVVIPAVMIGIGAVLVSIAVRRERMEA